MTTFANQFTALERVIIIATISYKAYDDSNPDVGMGPDAKYFLDCVLNDACIITSDIRYDLILSTINSMIRAQR